MHVVVLWDKSRSHSHEMAQGHAFALRDYISNRPDLSVTTITFGSEVATHNGLHIPTANDELCSNLGDALRLLDTVECDAAILVTDGYVTGDYWHLVEEWLSIGKGSTISRAVLSQDQVCSSVARFGPVFTVDRLERLELQPCSKATFQPLHTDRYGLFGPEDDTFLGAVMGQLQDHPDLDAQEVEIVAKKLMSTMFDVSPDQMLVTARRTFGSDKFDATIKTIWKVLNPAPSIAREKLYYYDLLKVTPDAPMNVIEAVYSALLASQPRLLSRQIARAAKVLLDPVARAEYDEWRKSLVGRTLDGFKVVREKNTGEYVGIHALTKAPVTIKHYRVAQNSEIIAEADLLWGLAHYCLPVVRGVVDLGNGDGYALVTSTPEGELLPDYLRKQPKNRADYKTVCWFLSRGLNVLSYLHRNNVIHGGLTPDRFTINPATHGVCLHDFRTVATPRESLYAAPEGFKSPKGDLYALGTIAHLMLVGDVDKVRQRQYLLSVPEQLSKFIAKLREPDLRQRPDWTENLLDAYDQIRRSIGQ